MICTIYKYNNNMTFNWFISLMKALTRGSLTSSFKFKQLVPDILESLRRKRNKSKPAKCVTFSFLISLDHACLDCKVCWTNFKESSITLPLITRALLSLDRKFYEFASPYHDSFSTFILFRMEELTLGEYFLVNDIWWWYYG